MSQQFDNWKLQICLIFLTWQRSLKNKIIYDNKNFFAEILLAAPSNFKHKQISTIYVPPASISSLFLSAEKNCWSSTAFQKFCNQIINYELNVFSLRTPIGYGLWGRRNERAAIKSEAMLSAVTEKPLNPCESFCNIAIFAYFSAIFYFK